MNNEQGKGSHYIFLLNIARSTGKWHEIPELVRKVTKHAPHRKCLILTAQSEFKVVQYLGNRSSTLTVQSSGLSQLIPSLLTAIETERSHHEDAFQARVCLGWVHWTLGEPGLAMSRLPKDLEEAIKGLNQGGSELSEWTHVCAPTGELGASQVKTNSSLDAIETFKSNLPLLSQNHDSSSSSPERSLWTECLLSHFCLLSSELATGSELKNSDESALEAFRAWARFWESRPGQGLAALGGVCMETGAQTGVPRRRVWKSYYDTLSRILQKGLPYPLPRAPPEASPNGSVEHIYARLQQRAELQHVQTTYEGLMLEEVRFPKADEVSREIEEWVESVIGNWRIFCGSTWLDEDLGEGGKEAVSRNVLEVLYRAAAKSFHSTPILRHLFTVHASLAEFNLAVKALDTYLELVTKAKARVEKSGELEAALDDDETILRTASEGIRMLCYFGGRSEAERARQIGIFIEDWLKEYKIESQQPLEADGHSAVTRDINELKSESVVSPSGIAMAYRAIGISRSHWARLTFDASSRSEIQAHAAKYLRKSLAPAYGDTSNPESLFALGLLLAESRDINGAIEFAKRALLPPTPSDAPTVDDSDASERNRADLSDGQFVRERSLIPFWHLLALLLSARQDFQTARKSCEAAFEQFLDPVNLFGRGDPNVASPNDGWLELDNKFGRKRARGVVDDMEIFEREGILQVKMTQLALVEVAEGSEVAVNASDELLGLYQRLFGDLKLPGLKASTTDIALPPPKSSSGTIRSFGGGLFSRQKSIRKNLLSETDPYSTATLGAATTPRPQTVAGQAPKIQVTDEDGGAKGQGPRHITSPLTSHDKATGEKLHKRHKSLTSLRKKKAERPSSAGSPEPKSKIGSILEKKQSIRGRKDNQQSQAPEAEQSQLQPNSHHEGDGRISPSPSQVGLAVSPDIPSPAPSTTAEHSHHRSTPHESPRSQLPGAVPKQNLHLPVPRFTPQRYPILRHDDRRRRSIRMLVKVWLLIAGLYRRASMYEDAKESVDEAAKLVDGVELEMSKEAFNPGWEGYKAVEELRGDVWTEQGYLSRAQSSHFEALSHFEQAVSYFPDHPLATVGLANILLDISSEAIQPHPSMPSLTPPSSTPITPSAAATPTQDPIVAHIHSKQFPPPSKNSTGSVASPLGIRDNPTDTPNAQTANQTSHGQPLKPLSELDLLAARDRAYGLLSSLTKLGWGWDFSEAWMALARAYEERGQLEKAKEALWWCVELEEGRPVRGWSVVNAGGFVL